MSLNDLELADEFDGIGDIRHIIQRIHNELGDFGGLNSALNRKVLKDVVEILKKGVKMFKLNLGDSADSDMVENMEENIFKIAEVMEDFFQCACERIDACGRSGRGKGGKGLGRLGSVVTESDYNEKKKAANDALDKFFKRAGIILKASPKKASPKKASPKPKTARCPRGTHRNKKTGNCESTGTGSKVQPVKDHVSSPKAKAKTARCPRGSRRNKKTGNCDKK